MNQPVDTKKQGIGTRALGIVGVLIGAAIGKYSGINLLIPLAATGLAWWLAEKFIAQPKKSVVPAFAVQAGHSLWLAFGIAYMGIFTADTFDLVLLVVGLVWLVRRPSRGPVYLLGAYQALSLVVNGIAFTDAAVGSVLHNALVVHVIWRALALFLLGKLLLEMHRSPESVRAPIAP